MVAQGNALGHRRPTTSRLFSGLCGLNRRSHFMGSPVQPRSVFWGDRWPRALALGYLETGIQP